MNEVVVNKVFRNSAALAVTAAALVGGASVAWANVETGQPAPWQLGFQAPVTEIGERLNNFHDLLLWIIGLITLFVTVLIAYVAVRFNRKANPNPSKTSHNTLIEVLWTGIPVLILVAIAVPSFRLLYFSDVVADPELTIKTTGHQWYWSYEYPDDGLYFDAIMVPDSDLAPGQPRLLATDANLVVPTNTRIRLLVTASDVIHSWAMPAFGVKVDAVPGRLNEVWFEINREGVYYGQCSELCGIRHAFMPITVEAVSPERYEAWLEEARELYAVDSPARPLWLAAASAQPVE
ncbi:MAG: cytochrome c oxidase subunit II [Sphingomonadales bacterium]